MDRRYKLYVHISPSGKRYYGITSVDVKKRWQNGYGYKNNEYFTRAIEKYGWDNFQHEVLFDNLTKEEAELMEKLYIALYDTTDPVNGYNITLGGESSNGLKHTEEWKQKHSEKMTGKNNPNYGKHFSEKTKERLSTAHKGKTLTKEHKKHISEAFKGENNPMYGKNHTEVAKQKMSKNHADVNGVNNPRARKVICVETGEIFNTVKDAYKSVNGNGAGISYAMKENRKYKGHTFMYYQDYLKEVA